MADAPTEDELIELRRLHAEASDVAMSHDDYLSLMFMATVDIERKKALEARKFEEGIVAEERRQEAQWNRFQPQYP